MLNLKKILVPVDFSQGSELSLKYAISFAREYKAQIHVLHVIEEEALQPGQFNDPLHTAAKWEADAKKRLDEFVSQPLQEFDVVRHVRGGMAHEAILDLARENGIDLIIVGAHGESGYVDSWLGGTSYEVARKSPCPVLTVKPCEHDFV